MENINGNIYGTINYDIVNFAYRIVLPYCKTIGSPLNSAFPCTPNYDIPILGTLWILKFTLLRREYSNIIYK